MNKNIIKVYHAHQDGYHHVANVNIEGVEGNEEDLLEYAYAVTNNVTFSWSKVSKDCEEYNPRVEVIGLGHMERGYRSTSVNDAMGLGFQAWVVKSCCFQKEEFPIVKQEWFR